MDNPRRPGLVQWVILNDNDDRALYVVHFDQGIAYLRILTGWPSEANDVARGLLPLRHRPVSR